MLRPYRNRRYPSTKNLLFRSPPPAVAASQGNSLSSHDSRHRHHHHNQSCQDVNAISAGGGDRVGVVVTETESRDDVEPTSTSPPLQHIPTYDEWEAAIVRSMSERPDEIFDMFERYAEAGRRERFRTGGPTQGGRGHDGRDRAEHGGDDGRGEGAGDSHRRRDGPYGIKRSYIAEFLERIRLNEAVAATRLAYPTTIVSVESDPTHSGSPATVPKDDHDELILHLRARLGTEEERSRNMAEQLKEQERLHLVKVAAMDEQIQSLEFRLRRLHHTDQPAEAEEASQMDETQVINDSPDGSSLAAETSDTRRGIIESEQGRPECPATARELQSRNTELERALATYQVSYEEAEHRSQELARVLKRARKAHDAEKKRSQKLELVVTKAESVLELQRNKLKKVELSQRKTRAVCDFEVSRRESLEQLNEKLKLAMQKMAKKLRCFDVSGGDIATLTTELGRKNMMILAIKSILADPTLTSPTTRLETVPEPLNLMKLDIQ